MRTGVRAALVAVLACLPALLFPVAGGPAPRTPATPGAPTSPPVRAADATAPGPGNVVPQPARSVTIALTGDVLVHNTVWQSAAADARRRGNGAAFDFRPMLAPVRRVIAGADLAICHLETPLAPPHGPYAGYPLFAAPQEVVPALRWAGYDACSTGSNHSIDQGWPGLVRTLRVLDRVRLAHTGTHRTAADARRPVVLIAGGIRIGWLEYTWGTNGLRVDPRRPWSVDLVDADRIVRDARRARRLGADAVLVGLHWGDEYRPGPSAAQLDLVRRLARSPDITLLYGHHAHVVQPIRRVHGRWVLFGLGNLVADQRSIAPGVDRGLIGLVTLTRAPDGSVRVTRVVGVPTRIDTSAGVRVRLAGRAR